MLDFLKSAISGWQHEEPCNFGSWALGEEIVKVAESMPWREGELHLEQPMSMGGSELEENHYFGSWATDE